jgi:hypothetical protein
MIPRAEEFAMTRLHAALLALAFASTATPVRAEMPTHLSCTFSDGYSWTYDKGQFKATPIAKFSFEIDKIDLGKQTASLIFDGKTAHTLKVVRALSANSFIEVADEGFLNLTTVYSLDPETGTYPAVHSRHFGLLGQPMFSQYAGSCTAKPDAQ